MAVIMSSAKKSVPSALSSSDEGDEVQVRAKWPDDCPDHNSEIITRALQVIGLVGSSQSAFFREYIAQTIFFIKFMGSGREGSAPHQRAKELGTVTDTLRRAIALLRREAKLTLLIRSIPIEVANRMGPLRLQSAYPLWNYHNYRGLITELEEIVTEAEEVRRQIEIGPGSPKPDMMKINAAISAYLLLCEVEIAPTLSDQGQYYQLAAVLYEGATGISNADLSRSCRLVFHHPHLRN
jgi:hypothetical protein